MVDKKILNSEILLCKSSIDALKEDLKTVDKKIQQFIDNDPQLKELFDIAECRPVDSVKGIGPVITIEVLITTNEFKALILQTLKNILAGYVPLTVDSLPLNTHQVNIKASP